MEGNWQCFTLGWFGITFSESKSMYSVSVYLGNVNPGDSWTRTWTDWLSGRPTAPSINFHPVCRVKRWRHLIITCDECVLSRPEVCLNGIEGVFLSNSHTEKTNKPTCHDFFDIVVQCVSSVSVILSMSFITRNLHCGSSDVCVPWWTTLLVSDTFWPVGTAVGLSF